MTKQYTTQEMIEKARQKRAKRMGVEVEKPQKPKKEQKQEIDVASIAQKFIKTRKGYIIKVDCFENGENFAQSVSYTEEQRAAQNEAVERNRYKSIVLANEQ